VQNGTGSNKIGITAVLAISEAAWVQNFLENPFLDYISALTAELIQNSRSCKGRLKINALLFNTMRKETK
jgi:hypothetical protein